MSHNIVGKLSLRATLTIPFIVIVVVAVGLTGYLAFRNGQIAVIELGDRLHQEITARVQQRLESYLATPHRINELNMDSIRLGQLDIQNVNNLERPFFAQLLRFENVASIYWASEEMDFISPIREVRDATFVTAVSDAGTDYALDVIELDAQGNRLDWLRSYPDYDPRQRPWYQATVAAGHAVWTPLYIWSNGFVGLDATLPVYDTQDTLLGVLGVSLTLNNVGDFLQALQVGENGQVFIVERSGLLIAASTIPEPYVEIDEVRERLSAFDCNDPVVRTAAQQLDQQFGDLTHIHTGQAFTFDVSGERHLARVSPYTDAYGLDWLIVVSVPESDLMAQVYAINRNTLYLAAISLVVSIVVAIVVARGVTRPILRLTQSAKALAQGNWMRRITFSRRDEIGDLSDSFNRMAGQLQASFTSLQASETRYRELSENLEAQVAARTAELQQMNETLEQRVTERSRVLEAEIAERQHLEKKASELEMLQELERLRSEFVSNVSHELRTPLGLIKASATTLLAEDVTFPPETQRTLLLGIDEETERLERLIGNLLTLAQVEQARLRLDRTPTDLTGLLRRLVRARQMVSRNHPSDEPVHHFVCDLPEMPPVSVDARRIEQVVRNLLSNAVKYSPQGGAITVRARREGGHVLIQVCDEGIGIPREGQERLFERFYRVKDKATRDIAGVGLGLVISREIVEAHGGCMWVKSEPGEGSTFSFTLPIPDEKGDEA